MPKSYMTTSSKTNIVGLAGTFASGKDTLAHHLVNTHDYLHVSTGDMIRAVATERYGNTKRSTLHKTANELRASRGSGVLVELALEGFEKRKEVYKGVIVSGIRSIGEAEAIKAAGGTLVFIDAPIEIRYQRAVERNRTDGDNQSFEEFKASEDQEMTAKTTDLNVQNMGAVRKLADTELVNGHSIDEFISSAKEALKLA
jgi:dephospho-CoA kinase